MLTKVSNVNPAAEVQSSDSREQIRSEIQVYLQISQQRRRLFPRAALVGLLAGIVAIGFRGVLAGGDVLRNALITWAHQYPRIGWLFTVLFGAVTACVSVFLVRRCAPEASGSGIPHLEAVLHRYRELVWKRVLGVKFVGGACDRWWTRAGSRRSDRTNRRGDRRGRVRLAKDRHS